uniref:Bm10388, isoform b n=1 Tax=Brugia malayi TaxID=6279 RepID=A0A0J9XXN4_BRUMA|nr:Bm10388, isoform b [Brugia malayi]
MGDSRNDVNSSNSSVFRRDLCITTSDSDCSPERFDKHESGGTSSGGCGRSSCLKRRHSRNPQRHQVTWSFSRIRTSRGLLLSGADAYATMFIVAFQECWRECWETHHGEKD